jgi:hypothetical protein
MSHLKHSFSLEALLHGLHSRHSLSSKIQYAVVHNNLSIAVLATYSRTDLPEE